MNKITKKKCIIIVLYIIIKIVIIDNISFIENSFYKNIVIVKNPDSYIVLVNKNNQLNYNYIPDDLELIDIKYSHENKYLRKQAKKQFEKLSKDAIKEGYKITAVSAYRDYFYQDKLYNKYVLDKGKIYADKASARAGHSEHQTGLAVDVEGSNKDYDNFEDSKEFSWMKDNAYKYGFILRYPNGKEHITGFKYEPWHYRYIGIFEAEIIYKNNLTLEEYYKLYIN